MIHQVESSQIWLIGSFSSLVRFIQLSFLSISFFLNSFLLYCTNSLALSPLDTSFWYSSYFPRLFESFTRLIKMCTADDDAGHWMRRNVSKGAPRQHWPFFPFLPSFSFLKQDQNIFLSLSFSHSLSYFLFFIFNLKIMMNERLDTFKKIYIHFTFCMKQ